jgi:hypothetical protein
MSHIYQVSPELFRKRGGFDDEFEDWMQGCLTSKWDNRIEKKPIELVYDEEQHMKEFEPETLLGD